MRITKQAGPIAAGIALSLMSMTAAHAEWKGKGELGLVVARGNTNTDTLSAKADLTKEIDPWKHTVGFSLLKSSSESVDTGDRYELHGQSDYKLTQRSYALGSLRYENDKFSAFRYQAIATVGLGYKIFDTDTLKLATEGGVGYRREEERLTGDTTGNAIFRGRIAYEQKLNQSTKVFDNLLVEAGSDNTFVQNEAGVAVSMTDQLALSVAYAIRYNSHVAAPALPTAPEPKHTDQLLTVNLVFAF